MSVFRQRRVAPCIGFALLLIAVLALAGCSGGGGSDGGGVTGGDTGGTVTGNGLVDPGSLNFEQVGLNFTIDSASVASPPVVVFSVTTADGRGVALDQTDVSGRALRFTIAKLVAGQNGDADHWQSYILTTETPGVGAPGPGGMPVLTSASQGTTESSGTLEDLGDGRYRYTFGTDITQLAGVPYDPNTTHRIAMQVSLSGAQNNRGETTQFVVNPTFDFVPAGGAVTLTKKNVTTDGCNVCHNKLQLHGGGRRNVDYCVTCHNSGTTDANSGNVLDFAVMIHKIHSGEELTVNSDADPDNNYVIYGFRDSANDYSTVAFPQSLDNCETCHKGSDSNWRTRPSMAACSACHDDVDFNSHFGVGSVTNADCHTCHVDFDTPTNIVNAHTDPVEVLRAKIAYTIDNVSFDPATRQATVDFFVSNPTDGSRYDIQSDTSEIRFTAGGVSLLVGWDTAAFSNEGSGSNVGQPIRVNGLFENATALGNNRFRLTTTALPTQATGTGVIGIQGHPIGIINGSNANLPVDNVVAFFSIDGGPVVPRRDAVSIDKCNNCHKHLSLHGGNRQGTVQICVICHNANATDISRRPTGGGIDGKMEEAIHLKYMIHAIHAGDSDQHGIRQNGIVIYGFGGSVNDFSHLRYPQSLANCEACHVDDRYTLEAQPANALATTIDSASDKADPADDLNISPKAATCVACHDTTQSHMEILGGAVFDQTQSSIDASVFEACDQCHGEGGPVEVEAVHEQAVP